MIIQGGPVFSQGALLLVEHPGQPGECLFPGTVNQNPGQLMSRFAGQFQSIYRGGRLCRLTLFQDQLQLQLFQKDILPACRQIAIFPQALPELFFLLFDLTPLMPEGTFLTNQSFYLGGEQL